MSFNTCFLFAFLITGFDQMLEKSNVMTERQKTCWKNKRQATQTERQNLKLSQLHIKNPKIFNVLRVYSANNMG